MVCGTSEPGPGRRAWSWSTVESVTCDVCGRRLGGNREALEGQHYGWIVVTNPRRRAPEIRAAHELLAWGIVAASGGARPGDPVLFTRAAPRLAAPWRGRVIDHQPLIDPLRTPPGRRFGAPYVLAVDLTVSTRALSTNSMVTAWEVITDPAAAPDRTRSCLNYCAAAHLGVIHRTADTVDPHLREASPRRSNRPAGDRGVDHIQHPKRPTSPAS